ncbi:hypothetical protein WG66_005193, partial [Moniliophthora roreri]
HRICKLHILVQKLCGMKERKFWAISRRMRRPSEELYEMWEAFASGAAMKRVRKNDALISPCTKSM